MSATRMQTAAVGVALAAISAYFLWLAGPGVFADFTPDDLMNMHQAQGEPPWRLVADNILFFSSSIRPLGAALYRVFYELFALNPRPLHAVCLVLALANVWLLFLLFSMLSGSWEVGLFTALIGAFHANFVPLYYESGTCYDLISFTCYYSALLYYVSIRRRGGFPGARQSAAILALFICALNAKEISVTLPAVIAAYELLYHPPPVRSIRQWRTWSWREARLVLIALPVAAAYAAGKVFGPDSLTRLEDYRPSPSVSKYVSSFGHYLDQVFYQDGYFTPTRAALFCCALLLVTLLTRSAYFRLCSAAVLVGFLPIAFIPGRGLYAAYVPFAGLWALGAGAVVGLRKWLSRDVVKGWAGALLTQAAVFLVLGVLLARAHMRFAAFNVPRTTADQREIRQVLDQLGRLALPLPRGARVLFVKDPFEAREWGQWTSFFVLRLYYHDHTIEVERCSRAESRSGPDTTVRHAAVLTYEAGELRQLSGCRGQNCCP